MCRRIANDRRAPSGVTRDSRTQQIYQSKFTEGEHTMAYQGKIQLTLIFVAPPGSSEGR